MDAFRDLLRELRESRHWSQMRLAEEAALDNSLVSRIESGKRNATSLTIGAICTALGPTQEQRDRLYLYAGFVPPDVPTCDLLTVLEVVRAGEAPLVNLALQLARAARKAA